MNHDQYILLYEKYLAGKCTAAEEKMLIEYMDGFELTDEHWPAGTGQREQVKAEIRSHLHHSIHHTNRRGVARYYWLAAASFVIAILTISLYKHWQSLASVIPVKNKIAIHINNDVKPGSNKATLQLADGSVIELNNKQSGVITEHDGVEVRQDTHGQLTYDLRNTGGAVGGGINTISTPVGGQYQVVLEDGTRVWLNAASSLTFPAVFNGAERRVEVTGEVYFEVAKNAHKPFKVMFNGNTISVLGTHFNVMAYSGEDNSNVTLVEGSVRLSNNTGVVMLKPGMQAAVAGSGVLLTRNVSTDAAIAWKNGLFVFENENIESIMRKLARWYNIEVVYKGNMKDKNFSGSISKFENVSEVLDMLELTDAIHFNLQGRRITVMP